MGDLEVTAGQFGILYRDAFQVQSWAGIGRARLLSFGADEGMINSFTAAAESMLLNLHYGEAGTTPSAVVSTLEANTEMYRKKSEKYHLSGLSMQAEEIIGCVANLVVHNRIDPEVASSFVVNCVQPIAPAQDCCEIYEDARRSIYMQTMRFQEKELE